MYETRWPRPGPALLAVGVVFGLLVGGILGISFPASSSAPAATPTTARPTRVAVQTPARFWTLVLASPLTSDDADAKLASFRAQGITGARKLTKAEYPVLNTQFAVCTGTYANRDGADAALQELTAAHPGLRPTPYPRFVSRST
jgi:hypothetical protein